MIVLLLILILFVLLFGAGAVLAGFGWLAVIAVTLTLLYVLIVAMASVFIGVRETALKLPRAAAFFRGYIRFLGAPVLGPIAYWRSVSERRARGEHVDMISTSFTFLWTFIVGVFLSWVAFVIPVLIVSAAYQAALG